MKKIVYLLGLVLLASCGDADRYDNWAPALSSEQEAPKSVEFKATAAPLVDFESVATDSVTLCSTTLTANDIITRQHYTITLYNTDRSLSQTLTTTQNGRVKSSELQAAVEQLYGKAGDLRNIPTVVTDQVYLESGEAFTLKSEIVTQVKLITPNFVEFIYEIGGDSQWSTVQTLRSKELDGNYLGYCFLNGEFKFRSNPTAWEGPDWEANGTEESLSENGTGNFKDPGKGFYKVEASIANGTLKLTKINTIGVIGDATADGWNADQDMTFDEANHVWEWTGHLNAGEIKFRANDDWALSWGGANGNAKAFNNLTEFGGQNLKVDEAGNYTIRLHLNYDGNNSVEMIKQ